jgi:hypothetical protein
MSLWRILLPFNLFIIFIYSTVIFASPPPSFGSAEHVSAGDKVKLYLLSDRSKEERYSFNLPSGLSITYGELMAFGDFYGVPGEAISQGKSDTERKSRFLAMFNSFAVNTETVTEAKKLLNTIHYEQDALVDGINNGEQPEDIYHRIRNETGRQFNCATGGGCSESAWWLTPGRYLKLASEDYDHFGSNAWITYEVGHELAMQEAIAARQTGDISKLVSAYAINGLACHFLSDRFSTGHMRAPREELPGNVTPSILGSLLVHYMHDEESTHGLHVHNLDGNRWIAFGDHYYFNKKNDDTHLLLEKALQLSANQIMTAYLTGAKCEDQIFNLIPIADEADEAASNDISVMFYFDNNSKKLMRREALSNPLDRHWTSNWWGWSTLSVLVKEHGELPAYAQAQLAATEYGKQAVKEGIITNKTLLAHINNIRGSK